MKSTTKALLASVAALAAASTSSVFADDVSNTAETTQQTVTEQVIETENSVATEPVAEQTQETVQQQPQTQQTAGNEIGTVDSIDIIVDKSDDTIKTYDAVKGSIEFHVDEQAKSGDVTSIQLPQEIELTRIPSQDIELRTENEVQFASAHFDNEQNKIIVKYNENAVGLQNIKGGFDFYYKLNLDVVKEVKEIELAFVVNNKQTISHKLNYVGIGEKHSPTFEKTSWQVENDGTRIRTSITIGKDGNGYSDMTIEDDIASGSEDNATYDYDSFSIRVGKWEWSDIYGWSFVSSKDITLEIAWLDKQSGQFKIAIPKKYDGEQISITYDLVYSSPVEANETIDNKAILKSNDITVSEWASYATIFNLSGWINGNKPVEPVKPQEPSEPDQPEQPEESRPKQEVPQNADKHAETEQVTHRQTSFYEQQSAYNAKLPETGETDSAFVLIGIAAVSSGVWVCRRKKETL